METLISKRYSYKILCLNSTESLEDPSLAGHDPQHIQVYQTQLWNIGHGTYNTLHSTGHGPQNIFTSDGYRHSLDLVATGGPQVCHAAICTEGLKT